MNRVKRLLVVLLTALTMVTGAASISFAAASDYYISGLQSNTDGTVTVLSGNTDHPTVGTVYMHPNTDEENFVYDGTPKEVGFTATASSGYQISDPILGVFECYQSIEPPATSIGGVSYNSETIHYKGTTAAGNAYNSTTAPTDAGKYTATTELHGYSTGIPGQLGPATIKTEFTIKPKPIDVEWIDNSGSDPEEEFTYNYDGENHVPDAKITEGLESGDKVSVNVTGSAKTVATHTATAKLVGPDAANYVINDGTTEGTENSKTKEFTIAPRPVTVKWLGNGGSETDFKYTYNGNEQGPTCEIVEGLVSGESCTVTVTGQQTDVGEYEATAKLSNTNYVIDETAPSSATHDFEIVEYEIVELTWDTDTLVYNADYQHPTAVVSKQGNKEPVECELVYTVKKGDSDVSEGTKMNVGDYTVEASLKEGETNFVFADSTVRTHPFKVTPYPVTAELSIASKITYDGKYHYPKPTLDKIFDVDKALVKPVGIIEGKTLSGDDVAIILKNDDFTAGPIPVIAPEVVAKGVTHASSGNYTAKLVTLFGEDEEETYQNYRLVDEATAEFEIAPKPVTLDWYRPANNVYGEYLDEEGNVTDDVANAAKVKTTGTQPKLVFNGKEQAPVAEIKEGMLVTNEETEEEDECVVTVSAPKNAIEVGTYTVTDIDFSNPDYTRDQIGQKYQIVKRPVKLEWDKYYTKYNGKEQERTVSITNIQKDEYGDDYENKKGVVVSVKEIHYSDGKHFGEDGEDLDETQEYLDEPIDYIPCPGYPEGDTQFPFPDVEATDGTAIEEARIKIDAGTRTMTAGDLTDTFNYTYYKLTGDTVTDGEGEGTNDPSDEKVDLFDALYIIHQHKIEQIDWRNTTVIYNASNQKPIAEVSKNDLQGPDTVKEVVVMIHDDLNSEEDNFAGKCNVGKYLIYVLKNEMFRGIKGDRCMNYRISGSPQDSGAPVPLDGDPQADDPQPGDDETEEPTKNLASPFVINKKLLTVTVNDMTGYYGDDPATYKYSVKYEGLVNGDVNKDDNHENKNIPGKYTPDEGEEKDVVEGTVQFTANYKKWGKPGNYSITASGLKSDNYDIKYVAGKLTIKNKLLSKDLVAKAKAGNKKAKISWNGVSGAAKYQIYLSRCDRTEKKYTPKLYKTLKANKRSFKLKKLKKNTYYKFYVVALDSSGKRIAKTEQHHFCTNNVSGKYTNPKKIKASKMKVTLNKGQSLKLKGVVTKAKKGKKLTNGKHTKKVRFRSSVPQVATVTKGGTIKGVESGWCRVYVMAANGIWKTVEVTVK